MNFQEKLAKYAEVIVKIGVNLQPGQRLLIGLPNYAVHLDSAPLVREITRVAYQMGASLVTVLWSDPQLNRLRVQYAQPNTLLNYDEWLIKGIHEYVSANDAVLYLGSLNHTLFDGLDEQAVATYQKSLSQFSMTLRRALIAHSNYSIVIAPIQVWAEQIGITLEEFWEQVFRICRVTADDPVQAWEDHVQNLLHLCDYLNARQYSSIHFKGPGTDLTVGLADGYQWLSGKGTRFDGLPYMVNMPTEEVFTTPHRERINGHVTATKPMSYRSSLIKDFSFQIENGHITNFSAKQGETFLRGLLDSHPTVRMLGEVALVPHSSPISQSNLIFYNVLYDENAACHMALGNAYRYAIQGGSEMTDEEFAAHGGNTSITHVDFMIGSGAMDVDGVRADNTTEPVMRQGEWAFDLE